MPAITRPKPTILHTPIESKWLRLPKKGSILDFGYDRGVRKSGPNKGTKHYHQGIDLPAPIGTPLYAMWNGVVTHAHNGDGPRRGFSGYGRIVVVKFTFFPMSDATYDPRTFYLLHSHCEDVFVKDGDAVTTGQKIATVGCTAFRVDAPTHRFGPKGAHDHFEIATTPYPKPQDRKPADFGRIHPSEFIRTWVLDEVAAIK